MCKLLGSLLNKRGKKVTVDGVVFFGGTECVVNEIKDGKVTDFEIVGIGLSK